MRILTASLLAGLSSLGIAAAQAADLDYGVLRGSEYETAEPTIDWSGVYLGGHGGYSSASLGFKNAFAPLIEEVLKSSTAQADFAASRLLEIKNGRAESGSFGAFAGFNYQFDDTVLGIEADYTYFDKSGSESGFIGRSKTNSAGLFETVNLAGVASSRIQDYGTIRVRAGYAVGNLLPFVTGGIAIGRIKVSEQVAIQDYGYDQTAFNANQQLTSGRPAVVNRFGYASFDPNNPAAGAPDTSFNGRTKTKVVGGFSLGGGIEFAITQNILLRGEYQYVMFNDFQKSAGNRTALNTVRGGLAIKF